MQPMLGGRGISNDLQAPASPPFGGRAACFGPSVGAGIDIFAHLFRPIAPHHSPPGRFLQRSQRVRPVR
jgi:hypothetical protein